MKTYKIIAICFGLLITVGLSVFVFMLSYDPDSITPKIESLFEEPAEQVVSKGTVQYRVAFSDGTVETGNGPVETDGHFILPSDFNTNSEKKEILSYSFDVLQPDRSFEVSMTFDKERQRLNLSGQGLEPFSDIIVGENSDPLKIRTDWAGLFSESLPLPSTKTDDGNLIKLALFNTNILSDIPPRSPLVIEALYAEGGGGPTGEGVNEYELPDCGKPKISICFKDLLDRSLRSMVDNYVTSLIMMSHELSNVMMQYVEIIGTFFDAKKQMETQRLHQKLRAEAHKDYHPSEQMCTFGSISKSLARDQQKADFEQQTLNKVLLNSFFNTRNDASAKGTAYDMSNRLRQFRETYCDIYDNSDIGGAGLVYMCQHIPSDPNITVGEPLGANETKRVNKDIDFSRTAWLPLTLEIDFTDKLATEPAEYGKPLTLSEDEEDVLALAHSLYWPQAFDNPVPEELGKDYTDYLEARNLWAMHSVAHNSYTSLIALKSNSDTQNINPGGRYAKALMKEFGLSTNQINDLLGDRPSYYAQMEVLTKKIYQHPDFYTHLYDKPANVKRINVALDAIKLMQIRDWHEASMRRELTTSLLIEEGLLKHIRTVNGKLDDVE